jgi:hypothetical protein
VAKVRECAEIEADIQEQVDNERHIAKMIDSPRAYGMRI